MVTKAPQAQGNGSSASVGINGANGSAVGASVDRPSTDAQSSLAATTSGIPVRASGGLPTNASAIAGLGGVPSRMVGLVGGPLRVATTGGSGGSSSVLGLSMDGAHLFDARPAPERQRVASTSATGTTSLHTGPTLGPALTAVHGGSRLTSTALLAGTGGVSHGYLGDRAVRRGPTSDASGPTRSLAGARWDAGLQQGSVLAGRSTTGGSVIGSGGGGSRVVMPHRGSPEPTISSAPSHSVQSHSAHVTRVGSASGVSQNQAQVMTRYARTDSGSGGGSAGTSHPGPTSTVSHAAVVGCNYRRQ